MKLGFVLLCSVGLMASEAFAAVACEGPVSAVTLTPEGDVYASWGQSSAKICVSGTNTTVNRGAFGGSGTINTYQCQALYSGFASALAAGKSVRAGVDQSSCTLSLNSYGFPDPYPYAFYFLNY
jgi:hypothetical protein